MNSVAFAGVLALAWFGASNVAMSLLASALARLVGTVRMSDGPNRSAQILFVVRVAPAAISILFTVGVFLPAHWRWEPAQAKESAGYLITGFAVSGAAIIGLTVLGALRDTWSTGAIARRWRTAARECRGTAASTLPVGSLADSSAVISLVGIFRPMVFIANRVEGALTEDELEVSVAHEVAHARAGDNLKRMIAAWCPDALGVSPLGRDLAARWRATTEFAADSDAVGGSEQRAIALASALLKVARLCPDPAAAILISRVHDQALLAARVERLLRPRRSLSPGRKSSPWLPIIGAVGTAVSSVVSPHLWPTVHRATEGLVRLLP